MLGKKLNCLGNEPHFLQCPSNFNGITALTFKKCQDWQTALLCNPGALLQKDTDRVSNIEGIPYISIDLKVSKSSFISLLNKKGPKSEVKVTCRIAYFKDKLT